ncbi:MAG TPA: 23S rRNA (adenine(2503)-C(2))-methyltransferase RlmN [Acidobacteriota bacterium]|nr:23S rRNA (adenine(2503)-C(2))-methyltransferase RlmN [Acidobacteriota bacterium]
MSIINIFGANREEIEAAATGLGEPRYRARQIYSGIYRHQYRSWEQFTDLGKPLREKLKSRYVIACPAVKQVFVSRDGARRYLFDAADGHAVESVFIPEEKRDTVCVSTQVGCALGCAFCVTGRLGMRRNLSPGEIVGQVMSLQSDRAATSRRMNVVLMGTGEPLNNYDNVIKALRLMTDSEGMAVSPRRITLSTAGIVPGILKLALEPVVPNLAVSLNAATDEIRDRLMPINRRWNIAALLKSCKSFPLAQRKRITFEYVLIDGVNDSIEDARRLAGLVRGFRQKINLIPLNEDPLIPLVSPSREKIAAFQQILADHKITVSVRRPRGEDISAACGRLAGREHALSADTP